MADTEWCPHCGGKGEVFEEDPFNEKAYNLKPCYHCAERGWMNERTKLNVIDKSKEAMKAAIKAFKKEWRKHVSNKPNH